MLRLTLNFIVGDNTKNCQLKEVTEYNLNADGYSCDFNHLFRAWHLNLQRQAADEHSCDFNHLFRAWHRYLQRQAEAAFGDSGFNSVTACYKIGL